VTSQPNPSHSSRYVEGAVCAALGLAVVAVLAVLVSARASAHGSYHESLDRLDALIAVSPDSADLYIARAELHSNQSDYQRALRDIERAKELVPERHDISLVRGRIHLEAGQPELAEPMLRRFLDGDPTHSVARIARARALVALGRHLEAADEFTLAIAAMPAPSPEPFLERASAQRAAGPEHWAGAVRGLDEGIAQLGAVVTLELTALDLEAELGRIDQALERLDRIAARSARKESWWARRGVILERAGRREEAIASFEEALREIQGLSPRRRRTPAMQRVHRQALEAVARLDTGRREVAQE
jgi:tetratricopeptide (TPR) repeat protein